MVGPLYHTYDHEINKIGSLGTWTNQMLSCGNMINASWSEYAEALKFSTRNLTILDQSKVLRVFSVRNFLSIEI